MEAQNVNVNDNDNDDLVISCLDLELKNGDVCMILEPKSKVTKQNYICDKKWDLDDIIEMYKDGQKQVYGIALLCGDNALIYTITKTGTYYDINKIKEVNIELQKKQKKGGQSAQRIGRKRDNREQLCAKTVATLLVDCYTCDNHTNLKVDSLIIAGNSTFKHKVMEQQIFDQHLKKHVLKVIDIAIDLNPVVTINNIIKDYNNIFEYDHKYYEKYILQVGTLFVKNPDILVFGDEIDENLDLCQLSMVLVDLDIVEDFEYYKENFTYGVEVYCCKIKDAYGIDKVGVKWF